MGVRVPGAENPDELWQLLVKGVDMVGDIPASRFDLAPMVAPDCGIPEASRMRKGGYLDEIDKFDAAFFGISPAEAMVMDPHQRLLLETVWEAIEDSGQPKEHLAGTRTASFVAADSSDYWDLHIRAGMPNMWSFVGGAARSIIAGRPALAFDLRGPSTQLDTACASGLTAISLACSSLAAGDATAAVVAGTHLIMSPWPTVSFLTADMLAPDGKCRFGDAGANGFARGEGVAAVVLKPLAAALADGDRVHAVIRGWTYQNGGQASGYQVGPAIAEQSSLLRDVYARAGVDPSEVDYVEAHGGGSTMGDAIELGALGQVFAAGRPDDRRLLVGSVKTNVGHSEATASLVGLVKAVLCLRNRAVPASLHLSEPSQAVDWTGIEIPSVATELGQGDLVVGVNANGVSGINAHVILAEAPESGVRQGDLAAAEQGAEHILVLSGHTEAVLLQRIRQFHAFLGPGGAGEDLALHDICYTAASRRSHGPVRLAVTGTSHAALARELAEAGVPQAKENPKVAFVLSGDAEAWQGFGDELAQSSPAFRSAFYQSEGESWAVPHAVTETLRAWGVTPDAVIAHGIGDAPATHTSTTDSELAAAIDEVGATVVVEIAPGPVVRDDVTRVSIVDGRGERAGLLRAVATLFGLGVPVRIEALHPAGRLVDLPRQPWQRESFWLRDKDDNLVLWSPAGTAAAPKGQATGSGVMAVSGELRLLDADQNTVVTLSGTLQLAGAQGKAPTVEVLPAAAEEPQLQTPTENTSKPEAENEALTVEQVLAVIVSQISELLKIPVEQVDPAKRIKALGLDSLMATQFRKRVESVLGAALTNRQVINAASVRAIAEQVHSSIELGRS